MTAPLRVNLPVCRATRYRDLVVDAGGEPVVPILNDAEENLLTALSREHGVNLRNVSTVEERSTPRSGRPVVAWGREFGHEAALYAHLTHRPFQIAEDLDAVIDLRPEMIILPKSRLTRVVVERLYEDHLPGLICGTDAESLRRRLLATFVGSHRRPQSLGSAEFYPGIEMGAIEDGDRRLYGIQTSTSDIRAMASSGRDLLAWLTHGNDFDILLGRNLALCDMHQHSRGPVGDTAAPLCLHTRQCWRHKLPIEDALESDAILAPSEIQAQILLLAICDGVPNTISDAEPVWAHLWGLLANPMISCLVTSWGLITPTVRDFASLVEALLRGESVGEAVSRSNKSSTDFRLCVFGDPRSALRPRRVTPVHPPQPSSHIANDVLFLRTYLQYGRTTGLWEAFPGVDHAADLALERANAYETAGALGKQVELPADEGPLLRDAFLKFMAKRGSVVWKDWLHLASDRVLRDEGTCPHCTAPSRSFEARFRQEGLPPRILTTCPACGVIGDTSTVNSIALEVTADALTLKGVLPTEAWTAAVHLGSQQDTVGHLEVWPADEDGFPRQTFTPEGPWPLGPLKIAFILLTGARLDVLTVPGVAPPWPLGRNARDDTQDSEPREEPVASVSNGTRSSANLGDTSQRGLIDAKLRNEVR